MLRMAPLASLNYSPQEDNVICAITDKELPRRKCESRETVCKKRMLEKMVRNFLHVLDAPYCLINEVMHSDLCMPKKHFSFHLLLSFTL